MGGSGWKEGGYGYKRATWRELCGGKLFSIFTVVEKAAQVTKLYGTEYINK